MDVMVEVDAPDSNDELRSLWGWLTAEDALRGRVRFADTPPDEGTLGPLVDALAVTIGPGGVATATATVLISWIRRRTSDISVKVTRRDGSTCEITASNVRDQDSVAVHRLIELLSVADGADPASIE